MDIRNDVTAAIGNTPLIKLRKASELTGCTILGKAEFMNPGQSVKDRAALFIIRDAIARGELKPGGTIVEGTAGNTGIGLTVVANALGFRSVIVIPETQSQEKKDALRQLGAELVEVPGRSLQEPQQLREVFRPPRQGDGRRVWANQFDNVANRQAHIETPLRKSGRRPTARSTASSRGRLRRHAGGRQPGLKAKNKNIKIALADPMGAALYSYYKTGELKAEGSSITEGIGQGRITKNLEGIVVDDAFQIPDDEALPIAFDSAANTKACAWAARRASTWPAPSAWPNRWDRATPS
jgi:cysteine synthase A